MPLEKGWSHRTVLVQSLSKATTAQPVASQTEFVAPAAARVGTGSAPQANDMFSPTAVIRGPTPFEVP
jgi:hypothetical protein